MNKHIFSIDEWKTFENVLSDNLNTDDLNVIESSDKDHSETSWNLSLVDEFTYHITDEFYDLNVSDLKKIMKYYKISFSRMKKQAIIQKLISFEMDIANDEIVKRRRRYWQYIYELLNDDMMSEYIHHF